MPTDIDHTEIWKTGRAVQEKYDYYLMALTVAAIGFTVQKTGGLQWTFPAFLPVAALLCWAVSLGGGFRRQEHVATAIRCLLIIITPPVQPEEVSAAEKKSDKAYNKGVFWRKIQFYFFLSGTVLFMVWHVWNMFENGK